MDLLTFNAARCNLCGLCIEKCPFDALSMGERGVEVGGACRMCGACIKICPQRAISIAKEAGEVDKKQWSGILIYAEQENGCIHPVVLELICEARKLAAKVNYDVYGVIVGAEGTAENAKKLLKYGLKKIFVYEHNEFRGFRVDSYANAVADCIESLKPSAVLVGATALGRSLAPRLSTRFLTGLTADCTKLEMREDTDLVQIRPAFGGNVMAQILISNSRPQFATVRYRIMERAEKVENPSGEVILCEVTDKLLESRIAILSEELIDRIKPIEEEDILVVAGRGVKDEKGLKLTGELARRMGGQLCFSRPMVEAGHGDPAHQIGLSGRTVKPKLIFTCGVSGAIQFAAGMNGADYIVAIDTNPDALIFRIANYCIVDDLYKVIPRLIERLDARKED